MNSVDRYNIARSFASCTNQNALASDKTAEAIAELIQNRKRLFAYLIEVFGSWKEQGDCIPDWNIPLGLDSKECVKLEIIKA